MGASPVRALLFDLWGTLIVEQAEVSARRSLLRRTSIASVLHDLGLSRGDDEIEAACLAAGSDLERLHASEADMSARARTILHVRHLDESLPDRLDDDAWRRMDEAVLAPALTHPPAVMDGAAAVLADVKALGLPIALVSNAGMTPGFILRRILEDHGLLRHFDALIFSDEVELAKPHPAIFAHALDELGVEASEAVFVGDQPVLDVFGSRRAGLWTVQIGDLPPDGAEPHARIDALAELVPALRSLGLI
jgi:HAD superfamily hydrolase (TIGR01509 family)